MTTMEFAHNALVAVRRAVMKKHANLVQMVNTCSEQDVLSNAQTVPTSAISNANHAQQLAQHAPII